MSKDLKKYYKFFTNKSEYKKLNRYVYLRLNVCPFDEIYSYIPHKNISKILDIGGGFGIFCDYLKFKNPKLKIEASEFDKSRVKVGKKVIHKDIKFSSRDASRENFKGYDLITMIDLLHHMPRDKQEQIFENLSKQDFKGKYILIKDIEKRFYDPRYFWNLIHDKLHTRFDKLFFNSDREFKEMFENFGFEIVKRKRIFTIAPYPHVLYLITQREK